jgi:predicted PurR-regulated permease PerM
MVEVKVVPPKRNWVQTWWQSLNSLSRLLVIALAAPLIVLNAWALSAIFGYFESLFVILLIAAVLSFLLGYPVTWLERQGLNGV